MQDENGTRTERKRASKSRSIYLRDRGDLDQPANSPAPDTQPASPPTSTTTEAAVISAAGQLHERPDNLFKPGNTWGSKSRRKRTLTDDLRDVLEKDHKGGTLQRLIAERLVALALKGNRHAIQEIFDRLDPKVNYTRHGNEDGSPLGAPGMDLSAVLDDPKVLDAVQQLERALTGLPEDQKALPSPSPDPSQRPGEQDTAAGRPDAGRPDSSTSPEDEAQPSPPAAAGDPDQPENEQVGGSQPDALKTSTQPQTTQGDVAGGGVGGASILEGGRQARGGSPPVEETARDE